jgi:hypothetical protein
MGPVGILVGLLLLAEVYRLAVALTSFDTMLVVLLMLVKVYRLPVALTLVEVFLTFA